MAYERVNWENLPSTKTPINADNLNKMDEAIDQAEPKKVPYVTLTTDKIKYRKINDIVEIIIQIQKEVTLEKGVWKELGRLPEGFRPAQAELIYPIYIWGNFGGYTDKCGKLSILQNGLIRVTLISSEGKAQNIMTVVNFSTIPEN